MRKVNSTNFENEAKVIEVCPIYRATRLVSSRWRTHILWALNQKPQRFSELVEALPVATERMVALRLKELREDKLVQLFQADGVDKYRLTPRGESLIPILRDLIQIGLHSDARTEGLDGLSDALPESKPA